MTSTLLNLPVPVTFINLVGKGENNVVEMAWDELTQRVINKMSDGYSLQVRHLLMIMNLFKGIVS